MGNTLGCGKKAYHPVISSTQSELLAVRDGLLFLQDLQSFGMPGLFQSYLIQEPSLPASQDGAPKLDNQYRPYKLRSSIYYRLTKEHYSPMDQGTCKRPRK